MARHPTGEALLAACRAGAGIIVMVEGEREEDDAWFYNRWFAERATEITFIAQNGWLKVASATAELRSTFPRRRVFGLRDRDFADEADVQRQYSQAPPDGVFRTERFTLENHLLEPENWLSLLSLLRRQRRSLEEVQQEILTAYRAHLPITAYNLALRTLGPASAHVPFLRHPDALPADPVAALRGLSLVASVPDVSGMYLDALPELRTLPLEQLHRRVHGRGVVATTRTRLLPEIPKDAIYSLLAGHSSGPPDDLRRLVTHLLSLPAAS